MEENKTTKKEVTMQDVMDKLDSLEKQMNEICGAVGMLIMDNLNDDMGMAEKIAHLKCSEIMSNYLFDSKTDEEKEMVEKISSLFADIFKK